MAASKARSAEKQAPKQLAGQRSRWLNLAAITAQFLTATDRERGQAPQGAKGRLLEQVYVPDFECWEKIIVEIKAASELADVHRAQLLNYLKATGHRLGILVNFGSYPNVEWERIVR